MSPPVVVPLGRDALSWVRAGGNPSRGGWSRSLLLRWQSHWFDRSLALQRQLPLNPLSHDPVFILGLWRSGTTYLHNLLSSCPGVSYPATWQCMNPASFRLQSPHSSRISVKRPMDGLAIDSMSPQEDEFALLALGVPSVYRGFFDPRRLMELTPWLDPNAWGGERPAGWIDSWRQFLAGVSDGRCERLVLKSPNHSFRIKALAETFPHASYVWLVRDPGETFHSNRKMWCSMFDRYAFWPTNDSILDEFLGRAFAYAAESLQHATTLLPRERLGVVRFDQLTGMTLETLEALNHRLLLGNWSAMRPALAQIAASGVRHRSDTYQGQQSVVAVKAIDQLRMAQLAALSSHGL